MELQTALFGTVQVTEDKMITFNSGLTGVEHLHHFVMVEPDATKPFYWLQSTDEDVALPLINPYIIDPEYSPVIDHEQIEQLKVESENELIVMAVVIIPSDVTAITANLVAPILINSQTGDAVQAICENGDYQVRESIYERVRSHLFNDGL